jgi:DNA (cytosine-5)-methyltransferase 1
MGRASALLGALTYNAERERLEAGEDKLTAHNLGRESALKQLQSARKARQVQEEYAEVMREWHAARLEAPMELLPRAPGGPRLLPELETDPERPGRDATVVSLFSGGFGLDLGFLQLGCDLRAALDFDKASREVARVNLPRLEFIHKDATEVSAADLLRVAGLDAGELTFLIGGPPCQPFSVAGKRGGLSDPRSAPVSHFFRLIRELRPEVFVMEEVPGLLSARMDGGASGTVWNEVLEMALATGYGIAWHVLNAADFGAPQHRQRVIMIGMRGGWSASLPETTHGRDAGQQRLFAEPRLPHRTFWDATADIQGIPDQGDVTFAPKIADGLRCVPPGGNWRQIPSQRVRDLMGGAYGSLGGRTGYFRRLSWDAPSPTATTSPAQKATLMGHPEVARPLSVHEYRRIQGFPDSWEIPGSQNTRYKQIGNAVSVHLARALAEHCLKLAET